MVAPDTDLALKAKAALLVRKRGGVDKVKWPDELVSARTGKTFTYHNEHVEIFVNDDLPRYMLLKGGEGAGKTVAGVKKTLEKLKRGLPGLMVSPDLEHFKKSVWPIFQEWAPWECVWPGHQRMKSPSWSPSKAFVILFYSENGQLTKLTCGGIMEAKAEAWDGANVNFVYFDEAKRHSSNKALLVLDGRTRLIGPKNEPSQIFLTSVPLEKPGYWFSDMFGPLRANDPYESFKRNLFVGTVDVEENRENLDDTYIDIRGAALTDAQKKTRQRGEWANEDTADKFVNIIWWDRCREDLPPLGRHEMAVLALDASKGGSTPNPDCFAATLMTRHPNDPQKAAIRYFQLWRPLPGQLLDFSPIKEELLRILTEFSIVEVAYDPAQLHDFASTYRNLAYFREFNQTTERAIADSMLLDFIISRRIIHQGWDDLDLHIDNAHVVRKGDDRDKILIVKQSDSMKVDGAVVVSQGLSRIMYYNLG